MCEHCEGGGGNTRESAEDTAVGGGGSNTHENTHMSVGGGHIHDDNCFMQHEAKS